MADQPSVPLAITSLPVAGQFWVITLLPSSSCNRRRAPRRGVLDYACLGGTYQIVSSISNATYCPISGICLCERRLHAAVCNVACSLRTDRQSSVREPSVVAWQRTPVSRSAINRFDALPPGPFLFYTTTKVAWCPFPTLPRLSLSSRKCLSVHPT